MKSISSACVGWAAFLSAMVLLISVAQADSTYHLLKEIPVGGEGGWDYLACDSEAHRLYVSHATKIVVVDTQTDSIVGEIADTPGVHGFALAPDLGRGFSSNGEEAKASVVELKTLQTLGKIATGQGPDAIIYASGEREVYAFNGKDHTATVFEAKSGKVTATIPLPGRPEFAAYDPSLDQVYDNIEDNNELAVINAKTHQVVNVWPIAPGEGPSGLAVDPAHHRLFIGCHNRLMLMMDDTSGKVLSSVPIGDRVDANAFDPGARMAFSSNGDGTLTVAHEDRADKLVVVQNVTTQKGARTMAIDLKSQKVYLATARFVVPAPGAPPSGRPKPIPGTFKILVYGK